MRRLLFAVGLVAATAFPAGAATGLAFLPQTVGQRVTYHVVRTTQALNGPQTAQLSFNLVRRAGTTIVMERTLPNGAPNISLLTAASDGTLSLSDPRTMSSDGDLVDVLTALNVAIAATREGDPAANGTWLGVIPAAPGPKATTAPLVLVPSNVSGGTFDFSGTIQTTLPADQNSRGASERGGGSARGGGMPGGGGGGFPGGGGGFPGGRRGGGGGGGTAEGATGERDARGPGSIAQALHVDGHVTAGHVNRLTITQQRSVIVAGAPFLNVGSWAITVGP